MKDTTFQDMADHADAHSAIVGHQPHGYLPDGAIFAVGDRVYSWLHGLMGKVTRINDDGYWFRADGWSDDVETLHFAESLRWQGVPTGRASELRTKLVRLDEITADLTSEYLVKGWISEATLSVVYGPSGVGKSFLAIDMSMHIASGKAWAGNRVSKAPVVYVAAEGNGPGIRNRIDTLKAERPDLRGGNFCLLPTALDLYAQQDAIAIAEAVEDIEPGLIVIDTLARSMGAGDENSAKDMGLLVQSVDAIREKLGCHVMLIHHSGKDAAKGARGSGALRAAADTEIELSRDGDVVTAKTTKQRDMEGGRTFTYQLRIVEIGTDQDGDKITSAVVEECEEQKRVKPLTGREQVAMEALNDAIREHGETKGGENFPSNRKAVQIEHWRAACDAHGLTAGSSEGAARQAFKRSKDKLMDLDLVRMWADYAWRVQDDE